MGTTQTVRERSRNISRSLQGHDLSGLQEDINGWGWVLRSTDSLKFRQLEIDGANGEILIRSRDKRLKTRMAKML